MKLLPLQERKFRSLPSLPSNINHDPLPAPASFEAPSHDPPPSLQYPGCLHNTPGKHESHGIICLRLFCSLRRLPNYNRMLLTSGNAWWLGGKKPNIHENPSGSHWPSYQKLIKLRGSVQTPNKNPQRVSRAIIESSFGSKKHRFRDTLIPASRTFAKVSRRSAYVPPAWLA